MWLPCWIVYSRSCLEGRAAVVCNTVCWWCGYLLMDEEHKGIPAYITRAVPRAKCAVPTTVPVWSNLIPLHLHEQRCWDIWYMFQKQHARSSLKSEVNFPIITQKRRVKHISSRRNFTCTWLRRRRFTITSRLHFSFYSAYPNCTLLHKH